ncbi:MAG: NADH:ubiquinone reductase (Na(+)-transporting) subunit B, partial [Simkaniaceae bacterium]|nr:NADH:ubiquinone reductase (Na(+)-transporting) subunit B [Simkaniaceae bacterium]
MLRKFLDKQLELSKKGSLLHKIRPLLSGIDTFLYEAPLRTHQKPHIRDAIDLKRWMIIVCFALAPCILIAIWNTGVQKIVYSSSDASLLRDFMQASQSFSTYFSFTFSNQMYLSILKEGLLAFLPVMLISYLVGGIWETLFASIRGHEISEGFLVTGILYALILPSTLPYWMVAVGVTAGVVIGKELFGGTGMNILNPALISRCFLFFTFPTKMSGQVWVGTNPTVIKKSLNTINHKLPEIDGFTQASPLHIFNTNPDIKRIHIDTIGAAMEHPSSVSPILETKLSNWSALQKFDTLSPEMLQNFVTAPTSEGGLALSPELYPSAFQFAKLQYGSENFTDGNFFFGNMIGSMGETSTLACLLGAIFLIWTGVGAYRTMLSMGLGAYLTALIFQFCSHFGKDGGLWNPAKFALPAYKHLLLGSLAFGAIFMATDPVSSPGMNFGKWIYGFTIGAL